MRAPLQSLDGTWTLLRFILRRDRVRLPVWILGIAVTVVATAASFPGLYVDASERQARAELMENPVTQALTGPGHGLDDYTFGAMVAHEMLGFTTIAAALMSIFLVLRHTRVEEEHGRAELVRATVVGRHAATAATLLVVCTAHLAIAALMALTLPPVHDHFTPAGSLLFAASIAGTGIFFAGIAIVAAQLTEHARGATGYGIAALGAAYTIRAVGDVGLTWLSWLSPIGWSQATRAYVDERWWPLLLSLGATAILIVIGVILSTRRDVGAGLVPARPGPRVASELLVQPLGFALRLQRGMLLAWGAGLVLLGVAYGTLLNEVEQFADDFSAIEDALTGMGGATFAESFVAMFAGLLAMLAAAAGVQATLRLRSEESAGRAEPVLATAIGRLRWAGSYLTVALASSAIILVLAGAGMGLTATIATNDTAWLIRIPAAAAVHIPALWLIIAVAMVLAGMAPRLAGLGWLLVVYGLAVGMFGMFLNFPNWVEQLSPFEHTPAVPAVDLDIVPLAVLLLLAVAGVAAGLAAFRRRDIGVA